MKSFSKKDSNERKKDFNNSNNILIDYNINKKNTEIEHKKIFKYKRNNNGVIEKRKIELSIPAHIENGQMILVRDEGNRTSNLLGHLIIKIFLYPKDFDKMMMMMLSFLEKIK